MSPEERLRRIQRKNALRLAAWAKVREATKAFLSEVEAGRADSEANLSYRRIAAALGISHQAISDLQRGQRGRDARQAAAEEPPTPPSAR